MTTVTIYFILILTAIAVIYDFVAYAIGGYNATISKVMKDAYAYYPTIAFIAGFICGHIFWPNG